MDQILGWTATIIFSSMIIPQIIKTIKTGSVENVSLFMFIMFLIGNIVALTYAFFISQDPLKIKYSIALISTTFYLIIYFKTKNKTKQSKNDINIK